MKTKHVDPDNRSLSEPLLSLLLRVIDSQEALQEFTALGALEVVCENLVKANRGMVNCQPSTVSIVMQHLSQAPFFTVKHNVKTQLTRTSTSKVCPDTVSGMLINFAPLGEYFDHLQIFVLKLAYTTTRSIQIRQDTGLICLSKTQDETDF